MINVLIIEDEKPAYQNLKRFIEKSQQDYLIVDWLKSVDESIEWFANNDMPDLIFLDIQLSDGLAFEIFEQVDIHSPIIFSTAYDEYAVKAFELNSVDYLLKPIDSKGVDTALKKIQRYHLVNNQLQNSPSKKMLANLIRDITRLKKNYTDSFLVKRANELIKLPTKNIAYIYADETTFCVADNGRIYSLNESLTNIIKSLNPEQFFRLNRKVICNITTIDKVKRIMGSKLSVVLNHKPDFEVVVSRERASEFKRWYQKI